MQFSEFSDMALPEIEKNILEIVSLTKQKNETSLYQMLKYHLGWTDGSKNPAAQGKRIRPLILLLTTATSGGNWKYALPAATAIELIHNFSLIHDDIEDQGEYRRGRLTLWKKHNLPLSLNAGDAMFALSFICLGELAKSNSFEISYQAFSLLANACLSLTIGQHLDISFEKTKKVTIEEYLKMIEGKTAALLAMSSKIGALIGGADPKTQDYYYQFGKNLGLAFQIHDDILGIWGDPQKTGKSAATDLIARKKSLPILYGLSQESIFSDLWEDEILPENIPTLANQLRQEGAYEFAVSKADEFTTAALKALRLANPTGSAADILLELVEKLTKRNF